MLFPLFFHRIEPVLPAPALQDETWRRESKQRSCFLILLFFSISFPCIEFLEEDLLHQS
uniref:Uncharacterized protein n=1 Tax=Arundo donax TaxID=35708 RepID=A0A0A8ZYZ3_ARUDO